MLSNEKATHREEVDFNKKHTNILEMIGKGTSASLIYDEIGRLYESIHPGLRCSMLELHGDILLHGGAPSIPNEYSQAVHGLKIGPNVGSCGAATYTGKRVIVENIENDLKWKDLKQFALPHGMRCCWSEPVISSKGKVLGAFGMYYDHPALPDKFESESLKSAAMLTSIVMERDQNQKRIKQLAYTDELTGFSSRAYFYSKVDKLINGFNPTEQNFGLICIDIDNFKDINDNFGHDIGDIYLQSVAKRIYSTCSDAYLIARLGGDEFCIVVKETQNKDQSTAVATRCLEQLSQVTEISSRKFVQSCSVGIAFYPDHGSDVRSLLKSADTALYSAKRSGKNQYTVYEKKLTEQAEYRFKVEQLLRESISNQSISVVYQPQFDANTRKLIAVETLSRWHHPELGHVNPEEFITTAERIGVIRQLTEHVLKTACTQAVNWKKNTGHDIRLAINVSADHFSDTKFVSLVSNILNQSGMNPANLELEVTETAIQTASDNLDIFKDLKKLGVRIALDDFGTGYSSFASLKHLDIDILKIDKYFVDDISTDSQARCLVDSMIKMAHELGYEVVAEGVINEQQAHVLEQLGADIVQGYFFAEPSSVAIITELIRHENE